MILLDTNILLRYLDKSASSHEQVVNTLMDFASKNELLAICPQNLYELYAVATRPKTSNGWGMPRDEALSLFNNLIHDFTLLEEDSSVIDNWKFLLKSYTVMGKTCHDARLVALMLTHQISKLYTLNKDDFRRFEPLITLV